MIVATTETIVGQQVISTIGQVFGVAVRTRSIEGNIAAGFAGLGIHNGDPMMEYTDALAEERDNAVAQMVAKAIALGANAVVTMRFSNAPIGHDMSEIVAYGTAVVIEPRS